MTNGRMNRGSLKEMLVSNVRRDPPIAPAATQLRRKPAARQRLASRNMAEVPTRFGTMEIANPTIVLITNIAPSSEPKPELGGWGWVKDRRTRTIMHSGPANKEASNAANGTRTTAGKV
jgi:hypothetical protein